MRVEKLVLLLRSVRNAHCRMHQIVLRVSNRSVNRFNYSWMLMCLLRSITEVYFLCLEKSVWAMIDQFSIINLKPIRIGMQHNMVNWYKFYIEKPYKIRNAWKENCQHISVYGYFHSWNVVDCHVNAILSSDNLITAFFLFLSKQ